MAKDALLLPEILSFGPLVKQGETLESRASWQRAEISHPVPLSGLTGKVFEPKNHGCQQWHGIQVLTLMG